MPCVSPSSHSGGRHSDLRQRSRQLLDLVPDDDVAGTVERMREIMVRAGAAVTDGLPITVSVAAKVRGQNFGRCRKHGDKGHAMWAEVHELLNDGLRRRVTA